MVRRVSASRSRLRADAAEGARLRLHETSSPKNETPAAKRGRGRLRVEPHRRNDGARSVSRCSGRRSQLRLARKSRLRKTRYLRRYQFGHRSMARGNGPTMSRSQLTARSDSARGMLAPSTATRSGLSAGAKAQVAAAQTPAHTPQAIATARNIVVSSDEERQPQP